MGAGTPLAPPRFKETRRTRASTAQAIGGAAVLPIPGVRYRLYPAGDEDDPGSDRPSYVPVPLERDDLPYKVELWDEAKSSVEQVLAVTASGSIGFAAYYAATREFPDRYVTLRHKNSIISRWNGPTH
jgi:hypothetical protein